MPLTDGLVELPDDSEALKAAVRSLLVERSSLLRECDGARRRAEEHKQLAEEQARRANDLQVENLRLQLELDRYRKWCYGPRADRLQSSADLAQLLLNFAGEMDLKPVNPDDAPSRAEAPEEVRRVKRGKGRRNLAYFENLPVTTQV